MALEEFDKRIEPEEFAKKMEECFEKYDTGMAHVEADSLMTDLLISLGYEKAVNIFYSNEKWYE